jgi:hypothetical protein
VDRVRDIGGIITRLRDAASVPDILPAAFDAFEAIRRLARDCEDTVPALFAAFMTTADAAVDGCERLYGGVRDALWGRVGERCENRLTCGRGLGGLLCGCTCGRSG